ncbi:SUPPRESSOR OF GAMMA RESPONSE 1 isoform X2 [Triticum aestivum]|uniref:SUPPRESSOR OF GAMMA RESPONSE 1 isoform X2 n=1 Tax=Triticum aestivum TaxID=4565 RepID=UPI001D027DD9|nr:SUPPRESSOR OF GAMMA RESPONSE 1-like isoform X2 [Triticum aestivum]
MARSWLITCRGVAKKVRNAHCSNRQISEVGAEACRECPNCKHIIDNSDVAIQWPGLPAGVKFDPSDLELLEHLEQKIGVGGSKPHMFIDEFIPTVENDAGICYSHPENLPGTNKDGSSVHFFHSISNAYGCGQRKRRRISNSDRTTSDEHVRWHKTGKSKPVYDNGVMKGWKKILVLYKGSQTGGKPDKTDWVMHQYHLGVEENEKVGEFVVSKIFYQLKPRQVDKSEAEMANEESNAFTSSICPKTPMTKIPPCRPKNSPCETEQNDPGQEEETVSLAENAKNPAWCALSSQPVEVALEAGTCSLDKSLHHHEVLDSSDLENSTFDRPILSQLMNETLNKNLCALHGLPDLHNVNLGTAPTDLQITKEESVSLVDEAEKWCGLASQAVDVASHAGTSLDESLRCHEVLDSFDHEKSLTFDRPIYSQGRDGGLENNLYLLNGLPDLQGVDLGTPIDDLQGLQFYSQESLGSWLDRM